MKTTLPPNRTLISFRRRHDLIITMPSAITNAAKVPIPTGTIKSHKTASRPL